MTDQQTREGYGPLQVFRSGAGYYVGRPYNYYSSDGTVSWSEPGSRDSIYFATEAEAKHALFNSQLKNS